MTAFIPMKIIVRQYGNALEVLQYAGQRCTFSSREMSIVTIKEPSPESQTANVSCTALDGSSTLLKCNMYSVEARELRPVSSPRFANQNGFLLLEWFVPKLPGQLEIYVETWHKIDPPAERNLLGN